MLWPMQHRLQKFVSQIFPTARERLHQTPVSARIAVKLIGGNISVLIKTGSGAVIERVCQWNIRLDPFKAEAFERKYFEKRRACRERMHGRTDVVHKAR